MPSKTPTRKAIAAQQQQAAAQPSLADMVAQAVAAAMAAHAIPGGVAAQAIGQMTDPVTGLPYKQAAKIVGTPAEDIGPVTAHAKRLSPQTVVQVDAAEYPAIHPDSGKPFKCPPAIRQRFMQAAGGYSFNVVLNVTAPDGTVESVDLADLKPHRFGTGNHGLMAAQVKEKATVADVEYDLTGGINLMLGGYRLG